MAIGKEILKNVELVKDDERWFYLDGRAWGPDSTCPVKIKVCSGGNKWGTAFNNGLIAYKKKISKKKQKEFDKVSMNPMLLPPDALEKANKYAVNGSVALIMVAAVGPTVKDPKASLSADQAKIYGMKKLPPNIATLYEKDGDKWAIPLDVEAPEEFYVDDDCVTELRNNRDFLSQVAVCRRELVDEDAEDEATEAKNSPSGSAGQEPGAD